MGAKGYGRGNTGAAGLDQICREGGTITSMTMLKEQGSSLVG